MCRMHSHAGLLQRVGPCFLGQDTCGLITSQQHKALKCVCMRQYFYLYSKLNFLSRPEFAVCCLVLSSSSSFFSHRTSFLVLCVPPIPHFLLFHLVWLWGLGWRGNGGHRPVSILFARFLLLQAYCTFAAGIGKSLAPPSPTHTLSETCRREWVLRKYKRYQSLPVIYTDDFGPACV